MHVVRIAEAEAVGSVNFRLLRPTLAGVRYDARSIEVRLEGPPYALHPYPTRTTWSSWAAIHNASVRYPLRTSRGILGCKQYLYDLGPLSAVDHAALYDHRAERMRAHSLDGTRLAWTGYDHRRRRALTMLAWGTSLELRELEGSHREDDLVELARSLQPLGDGPLAPMSERSYWSRYPRYDLHMCRVRGYRPPSSLWRWRWPWLAVDHRWQSEPPTMPFAVEFDPAWHFDSACVFGDRACPGEVQVLFQPISGSGHAQVWLRQFPRASGPLTPPVDGGWPRLDSYSGYRQFSLTGLLGGGDRRIYVASRSLRHGPHDAVWWHGDHGYLLQLSAAVRHDLGYLATLLSSLLAEPIPSPILTTAPAFRADAR